MAGPGADEIPFISWPSIVLFVLKCGDDSITATASSVCIDMSMVIKCPEGVRIVSLEACSWLKHQCQCHNPHNRQDCWWLPKSFVKE
eukprot:6178410-Pleurochrysis_carterae.AAC.2